MPPYSLLAEHDFDGGQRLEVLALLQEDGAVPVNRNKSKFSKYLKKKNGRGSPRQNKQLEASKRNEEMDWAVQFAPT